MPKQISIQRTKVNELSSDIWIDDKLNRKLCADQYTRLLEHAESALVVSVSSPFGTGKTFFAERWKADLRSKGKCAIGFNAWGSDFAEEPLIAFMAQLHSDVSTFGVTKSSGKALKGKLMSVARRTAGFGLRVATRALIGSAVFSAIGEEVNSATEAATGKASDELESFVLGRIDAFTKQSDSRDAFRHQLGEWRKELIAARSRRKNSTDDHKIYILIDELDRCRPDFALRVLETIKHLFDLDGFVFIIFVDEEQLQRQTAQIFGERKSGEPFLRKFIDYRLSLPRPSHIDFANFLISTSKFKGSLLRPNEIGGSENEIARTFAFFSEKFDASLRTQIRVFKTIELVSALYSSRHVAPLIFMSFLRECNIEGWEHFRRMLSAPEEALRQIDYIQFKERLNTSGGIQSENDILNAYLYTRIFLDGDTINPISIDRITQHAQRFFREIFDEAPSDAIRRGETTEMLKQIDLILQFEISRT